jgi:molecular chaperone GrpE
MTLENDTDQTAQPSGEDTPLPTAEEEISRLKQEMAAEADKRLRAMAEADNLKKRLIKEKEEFVKFAAEGVLADLLPVLDNLDLALAHGRSVAACKDVVLGVDMTRKIFLDILARHGLEPCGLVGEEFNPEMHEAMGVQPAASGSPLPPNSVAQVMQAGYRLRGRLLRPAKVLVSPEA